MAITLKELTINASDVEKLVERLRLERKALETQIKEKGCEVGIQSAQRLSYQEFQRIERVQQMGINLDEDSFAHLCTWLESHNYYDDAKLIDGELRRLLSVSEHNQVAFVKGWLEAVLSVWNRIKNQVNAEDGVETLP